MELTLKLARKAPLLPVERKQFTRTELADTHGARQADVDKVRAVLESYGLSLLGADPAKRAVYGGGRVAVTEQAFEVKLVRYHHRQDGNYRGRAGTVHASTALTGVVVGVYGLDHRRLDAAVHDAKNTYAVLSISWSPEGASLGSQATMT